MCRKYLNEKFLNGQNIPCQVIAEDDKFVTIKFQNAYDNTHKMLKREYEIHHTFGSYRLLNKVGEFLYV